MKKIDLHIHTLSTRNDADFEFDIDKLSEYTNTMRIDCIAVTNHNTFDKDQFLRIKDKLTDVVVMPGIEIDLCGGHILLITEYGSIDSFVSQTKAVYSKIVSPNSSLDYDTFRDIFPDLSRFLVIPHYWKEPKIPFDIINKFGDDIFAGEVTSPKKFIYAIKDPNALTPVVFSDCRLTSSTMVFSSQQTFVDIGDITLNSLKSVLHDKSKVSLNEDGGHDLISIQNGEIKLSTGLNIILGRRSSGKTHTLQMIKEEYKGGNIKYIKQFQLLERDDKKDKNTFDQLLADKKNSLFEDFISPFKTVIEDLLNTPSMEDDESVLDNYLGSLIQYAKEERVRDVYSKCALFSEELFSPVEMTILESLIRNVSELLDNRHYKTVIDKHIERSKIIALYNELILMRREISIKKKKKEWTNDVIREIKGKLQIKSSSTPINDDLDLYQIALRRRKRLKFINLCKLVKRERKIRELTLKKFKVIATTHPFVNATDLKQRLHVRVSLAQAYLKYDSPIDYLKELRNCETISPSEFYKLFVDIEYKILNEDGFTISGGESAEFNLLQTIEDARNYDMLLIDEPESSFDNIFLKDDVNSLLKEFSKEMPVVIVTHNSTIGGSIQPDYILFTEKQISGKDKIFKTYYGYPNDKFLRNKNNEQKRNYVIQIDSLEAGSDAYQKRNKNYENLEN